MRCAPPRPRHAWRRRGCAGSRTLRRPASPRPGPRPRAPRRGWLVWRLRPSPASRSPRPFRRAWGRRWRSDRCQPLPSLPLQPERPPSKSPHRARLWPDPWSRWRRRARRQPRSPWHRGRHRPRWTTEAGSRDAGWTGSLHRFVTSFIAPLLRQRHGSRRPSADQEPPKVPVRMTPIVPRRRIATIPACRRRTSCCPTGRFPPCGSGASCSWRSWST